MDKGGKCERVKSIPAGATCYVLTSPWVVLRHNEVQEPLSRGKLWISSKGRPCVDFHFWREHIGGCRKDGLGAGDRRQGQWVRSLLSPSEGWWGLEPGSRWWEYAERERCTVCDSGETMVVVEGVLRRH